ncbi:Hypothetical protein EUBELI_00591 [Lachnospira eligens ATCC 27750]|uniref:Uncharacterized protein n=1 Tax=Lachnospira eligens (strain ATCC 27750 / DSM 3376 / VPI C15-48 / C15-B4) TaxID=515620 RepID=C4Z4C0_LACE2|nr:Hypothetical protein EUBELI_00591 [[Eubacterium] eligens ATCC 27750]
MVINHVGDVAFIIHYDFLSIHKKFPAYMLILQLFLFNLI